MQDMGGLSFPGDHWALAAGTCLCLRIDLSVFGNNAHSNCKQCACLIRICVFIRSFLSFLTVTTTYSHVQALVTTVVLLLLVIRIKRLVHIAGTRYMI